MKTIKNITNAIIMALLLLNIYACRKKEIIPPEIDIVATHGFYLLNEGNMGTNKATLDYMDLVAGKYHRNIYGAVNPSVPKDLGDVGNDLQIYGSKLYAVINASNKVEVMNKHSAQRLGQIDIPNCRYITFHEGYAYITSYAGPIVINPQYAQLGYVAKVDTASLQIVDICLVGFQPDEIAITNNKIYVANSGGYMVPNYENTVSVLDLASFTEICRIEVAVNLHRLEVDQHGILWVSSRGDYRNVPSRLFWINTQTDTLGGMLPIAVTEMTICGDSLYFYGDEFNYDSFEYTTNYAIVNVQTKQIVTRNFLSNGAATNINRPGGIMINPQTQHIYITDVTNSVHPGVLFCFDKTGRKLWQEQTGDIPAHFALLYKQ